jgi:hypothetical protein
MCQPYPIPGDRLARVAHFCHMRCDWVLRDGQSGYTARVVSESRFGGPPTNPLRGGAAPRQEVPKMRMSPSASRTGGH